MLVLDSSGSMTADDAGGQSRIDAARDAAHTFIEGAGDDAPLGLVTYGGNTGETPEDYDAGCRDITVVTGPESGNSAEMIDHVESLEPRGYTPIGDALRAAADELPDDGARTIVLVSDGIATCTPPPVCEVAEELKQKGVDLVINTVGFNVDPAAREELECIADVAGGTYADASDADTLAEELRRATTRTYRAYESDLRNIPGGDSELTAADVGRDVTEFSTSVPPVPGTGVSDESVLHFTTPFADGERIIVSATTTQAPSIDNWDGTFNLYVRSNDYDCELDTQTASEITVNNYQTATLYSHANGDNQCDTDELNFRIGRRGDWNPDQKVDVDVTVTRLGVPDLDGQPTPVEEATDPPTVTGSGEGADITPGTWFTDATELDPGETVRAEIVPGETHFFRIPVEHGQRLTGAVIPVAEADDFADLGPGENLLLTAYNEARGKVPLSQSNVRIVADRRTDFGYEAPILFTNRYGGTGGTGSDSRDAKYIWQDGDQVLTVRYDRLFSQDDIDATTQLPVLTYTLVADAVGEPVPAPTFTPVEAASTSTSAQPSEGAEETDTDADAEATADEDAGFPALWVVLGAVLLAVLGVVGYLLTRRRGQ